MSTNKATNRKQLLESHLQSELSDVTVSANSEIKPTCKRCEHIGASARESAIDGGNPVYIRACWEECTGWRLFGIYHLDHATLLDDSDPVKPTAILRARLTPVDHAHRQDPNVYTFDDVSLIDTHFPETLYCPPADACETGK